MPEPVIIVPYDPVWVQTYDWLRRRAASAVGDIALGIEHIGSSSVPGLAAKPIIDMVIIVGPSHVQTGIQRLIELGYTHRGSLGVEGRDAFGALPGDPQHHLYVSPSDSDELRAQLAFRDRLRTEPNLASEYAALKHQLAIRFRHDRMGYTDAKTNFVTKASQPLR